MPPPFDNTYNSPEHDAFVLKVKYQRSDKFFTENMVDGADRARLNQAWNDLFGSWPYHDAYLGMLVDHYDLTLEEPPHRGSRRRADRGAARRRPAVPHGAARALRRGDEGAGARRSPATSPTRSTFASRAWRRPLTAAEKASLRAFYQKSRTVNQLDHDDAMRALLARILVSPAFLYRVETVARGPEKPLNGWELASRLSFFLWSSIPDDELRRAAAAGELSNPAMLARQVKRMTADPKARRLATEFFGQWLGFYHFDQYRGVDTGRFPEFTDEVKSAMYDEAVSTFEYIVRQERPVKEILYADYTFLNKPLAKFYGIDKDVTVERQGGEGRGRERVQSRRRAAARLGADDDVGAAADQPGQARRLGAAARPRHADAAAAGRRRHASRRRQVVQRPDAARAAGRAQAQRDLRRVPPAHRPARLPARGLRRGRPDRATSTPTASRSTSPASSPTRRPSSAPTACWSTCRRRTSR